MRSWVWLIFLVTLALIPTAFAVLGLLALLATILLADAGDSSWTPGALAVIAVGVIFATPLWIWAIGYYKERLGSRSRD